MTTCVASEDRKEASNCTLQIEETLGVVNSCCTSRMQKQSACRSSCLSHVLCSANTLLRYRCGQVQGATYPRHAVGLPWCQSDRYSQCQQNTKNSRKKRGEIACTQCWEDAGSSSLSQLSEDAKLDMTQAELMHSLRKCSCKRIALALAPAARIDHAH